MRAVSRATKAVLFCVSFLLAMVLYLTVQEESPLVTDHVELEVRSMNLTPGLVLDEDGSPVQFDVTGPRDKIDLLKKKIVDDPHFIVARIDLRRVKSTDLNRGKYPLPLQLSVKVPPEFDSLTFEQYPANGVVEPSKTIDVKIKVQFQNSTPVDKYEPDDFEVDPSSITLTGPASRFEIAEPHVVIDPETLERDGPQTTQLIMPAGLTPSRPVESVIVTPAFHKRAAYVNVNFLGHPATGYRVSNYYVVSQSGQTSTAAIMGPAGLVDKTPAINTSVDISGLTAGFTFQAKPTSLPDQLQLVESPLRIRVDVEKIPR